MLTGVAGGGVTGLEDEPFVLWLDDPRCSRPELTGNKCATLAILLSRGYAVPRGFCLTTRAVSAGRAAYKGQLAKAVRRLRPPWVARSSSTSEDSQGHAFPGLFTTVLDLPDAGSLSNAIEKIEAGIRSEGVLSYARNFGVDLDTVRMAILVQVLVPATAAGVAFSRDPVSQEENIVIESNYGLGESVVDGSITPDSFVVGRNGEMLARTRGTKRQKVVVTTRGTRVRRVETSELERSAMSVDDKTAVSIAKLTRRLEEDLGYPVDFEWALVGDQLQVLQARPITTIEDRHQAAGGPR